MEDEIEFDWEVIEVINTQDKRGAMVTYTPVEDARLVDITIFVPIPWHKATDIGHARTIAEKKILSRAPRHQWARELSPTQDKSKEIVKELKNGQLAKGEYRRDANRGRSEKRASVPE